MKRNYYNLLVLCLLTFLIASVESKFCNEANNTNKNNCEGIFNVVHKCNAAFVNQAMLSADPFTVCSQQLTFMSYRYTMEYYSKLFTTYDTHNTSILCADKYLNKNKMNVISNLVGSSENMWESAHCENCYSDSKSIVQHFSNTTTVFNESLRVYNECLKNVTNRSENASLVCVECNDHYQTLNNLYDHIKRSTDNKICFDLEDKMNKTRRDWSGLYKCCKGKRDSLAAFYCLSAALLIIAFSFYCAAYFFGSKYPAVETLDEREISGNDESQDPILIVPEISANSTAPEMKNLLINGDDSSDDDILTGD